MASDSAKWIRLMSDCLAAAEREQVGSPCPVVDHEVLPSPSTTPDDMCVWLICRNQAEKQIFRDTEQSRFVSALKKRMLAAGFPESAVASLIARSTSRTEIESGGGRAPSFR